MLGFRDIIVLTLLVGSLPFCFIRPAYGTVVWTVMSFLNPQTFTYGLAREWSLSVILAVPTLLGWLFFSLKLKRLLCREVILMAILWLWFTVTLLNADQYPLFADKAASAWYRWGIVSKVMLMAVVAVGTIDTWARLRWVALAIAGSFGFLVVKALPGMLIYGGDFHIYGPPGSMIGDNNDFGLALNMALPFFFFLAKTESSRYVKAIMAVLFAITIPTIFFTYSRGALLGLIAVLAVMLVLTKERRILIPMTILAIVFAALFTPPAWRGRMTGTTPESLDASALSRLNAWSYSWALAKDYPLMGGGFEAFTPSLFTRYAPDPRDVHGPHSIYLGVLAEHGFTGLFLYLGVVAMCFSTLRSITKKAQFHGDVHGAAYASMFRLSLVGFLVSGTFLGRAYFDFYFTILACTGVLRMLGPMELPDEEQEESLELQSGGGEGALGESGCLT